MLDFRQLLRFFVTHLVPRLIGTNHVVSGLGLEPPPEWLPDPSFRWIPEGTPVRYLGCQIGLELTAEQQIAPLLLSIRRKLIFWSSARLSLAGQAVVANQVLLATMWYVTSC